MGRSLGWRPGRSAQGSGWAAQRVEIHANSEVVGNIISPSLYVEVGALFDGQCDMSANESKIIKLVKEEGIEAGTSG